MLPIITYISMNRWFVPPVSLLLLVSCFVGCKHSTPTEPPVPPPTSSIAYVIDAQDLRTPRSNETYMLWVHRIGDTAFLKVSELVVDKYKLHGPDSIQLSGTTALTDTLTIYDEALISLERDVTAKIPGSVLLRGKSIATGVFDLDPQQGAVADLRFTTGSATFVTASSDTTRVFHEFYLMDLKQPTPIASLNNLPNLGFGWHYAVWVTDSSFSPFHLFYYGAFLHPAGHDSDSANDSFPFPGGYEPPSLVNSRGKIEVTVEPDFQLPGLKARGPSTFPILEAPIPSKIFMKEVVPLTNVVARGLPGARLSLKQK